jgi:hypothetical protein
MQNLKVFFAVGAVGLAAAVAVACSSSSPAPSTPPADDAGNNIPDDAPMSCIPLTTAGLCPGQMGLTCCVTGLSGTCVPAASCTQNIAVACNSAAQCTTGQSCCANLGGSLLAAFEDGGIDAAAAASGLDAASAAALAEGGAAGAAGLLAGVVFKVNCETSCAPGEIQACATDKECNGGKCVPLTDLLPDAGIDAGAASSLLASAGMNMACTTADGGLPGLPGTDAGNDAGNDAATTTTDAGTDAGIKDAAADAPAP